MPEYDEEPNEGELTEAQLAEAPEVERLAVQRGYNDLPLQDDIDAERRALKEKRGEHKRLAIKSDHVGRVDEVAGSVAASKEAEAEKEPEPEDQGVPDTSGVDGAVTTVPVNEDGTPVVAPSE